MKSSYLLLATFSFFLGACQSGPAVVQADAVQREALLGRVSALEGRWRGEAANGPAQYTEFAVTSGGSVVRELMMPGTEHEMTNMYSLDGNSLVMTHYCAVGNQPRMRATSFADGRLEFRSDGVSDLKARDEIYMGSMTLVIVDEDNVEEHWSAFKDGKLEHEMTIKMTRVQ